MGGSDCEHLNKGSKNSKFLWKVAIRVWKVFVESRNMSVESFFVETAIRVWKVGLWKPQCARPYCGFRKNFPRSSVESFLWKPQYARPYCGLEGVWLTPPSNHNVRVPIVVYALFKSVQTTS